MNDTDGIVRLINSNDYQEGYDVGFNSGYQQGRADAEKSAWHIVTFHEITDEEREREEYPNEWVYYLDCTMPEDNEQILIVTKYKNRYEVEADVNYSDDGFYLDSGTDWQDVVAWREMPTFDAEKIKEQNE